MFTLKLLGGAAIEADGILLTGTVAQRRRLALLALLAASPTGAMSRERLAAFLFPDADAPRAHRALSDALHAVRRTLGRDAVLSAGDELRLNEEIVRSDLREFNAALEAGDLERAAVLYRGPFLDGFFVSDVPDLERWIEAERDRLGRRYAEALERLIARNQSAGELAATVPWLRRLAALEPLNSSVATRLMLALEATGDPAGALQHANAHKSLLRAELGMDPPSEMEAIAERLRSGGSARPGSAPGEEGRARPTPAPSPGEATKAAPPGTRRSGVLPRGAAIAAALAVLLAFLAFTRGALDGTDRSAARDVDAVVVFPIASEDGDEIGGLARSIAELLRRNLDGAGDLRIVDPGTVTRQIEQRLGANAFPDVQHASTIAAELSADRFVMGRIAESGGKVRVHLALYRSGDDRPFSEATADSPAEDLFGLTDQLTADLLAALVGPASRRVARTAALTSRSLPAVKEFLRAEQAYRHAIYDSAIAGFQRAVTLDSTFALAYYRLAVVSGLYDREPNVSSFAVEGAAPTALERALALADRLSAHDRQLLAAYSNYRRGAADDAERVYRTILRDYPDDLEARFLLAEVQFRYNALRGRHPAESRPDYDRVLRTDPEFFCPI